MKCKRLIFVGLLFLAACSDPNEKEVDLGIRDSRDAATLGDEELSAERRKELAPLLPGSGCTTIEDLEHALSEVGGTCNDLKALRQRESSAGTAGSGLSDKNPAFGEFLAKCAGFYNVVTAIATQEAPDKIGYYSQLTLQFIGSSRVHLPPEVADGIAAAETKRIQVALAANDPDEAASSASRQANCLAALEE